MNKNHGRFGFLIAIILILCIACSSASASSKFKEYKCDVKSLNMLYTEIIIDCDGERYALIRGNIVKIVTDPLTMYNKNGEKIGYASDDYNFISQDSHEIVVGDTTYKMAGKFSILGEHYDIYKDSKVIATASFGSFDTSGEIKDKSGKKIAEYSSGIFRKDYVVKISEGCSQSEADAILLMMASYYSDKNYDSNSNSTK